MPALPREAGTRCGRARSRGAGTARAAAGARVHAVPGPAAALREAVRILLAPRGRRRGPGLRAPRGEPPVSSVTAPGVACFLRICPKEQQSVQLGSSLAGSRSRRCQAVREPRSPRLALSRPPPGPRRARAGSCLPETCPAVCACVCLSKSLPLHHSGAREEPRPRRPAAEWLPVHTLPALSPPTPPLLLALRLLPLLLLQQALPSSQRR